MTSVSQINTISGFNVTVSGLLLTIAAGHVYTESGIDTVSQQTASLAPGRSLDRLDLVYLDKARVAHVATGSTGLSLPEVAHDGIPLAIVAVAASASSITNANITDARHVAQSVETVVDLTSVPSDSDLLSYNATTQRYAPRSDPNGIDGLMRKGVYRATYDFAVDGGVIGPIVPSLAPTLPAKAVITRAWVEVLTAFTGGAGATIAWSVEAANDLLTAATIATNGHNTTGFKELSPDGTAAKFVKTSTTRQVKLTVAVNALTAGKAVVILEYAVTK